MFSRLTMGWSGMLVTGTTSSSKPLTPPYHDFLSSSSSLNGVDFYCSGKTDYSFAESAAAAGWATLSYDRLGVGRSDHPDGTQVVQIPYEIAQSVVIAGKLRDGSMGNGLPKFDSVVGVGHCRFPFIIALHNRT